jgi:chromosome segregation ATPase
LPGIIGAVADLVSFDKQYATAMDIALAGALKILSFQMSNPRNQPLIS